VANFKENLETACFSYLEFQLLYAHSIFLFSEYWSHNSAVLFTEFGGKQFECTA